MRASPRYSSGRSGGSSVLDLRAGNDTIADEDNSVADCSEPPTPMKVDEDVPAHTCCAFAGSCAEN
eukprot:15438653-Alexandrium_andersonii.AAC.1